MAYSIFIVFQRCICDETMKYSPQKTALSLFWKGRMHLLGTVAVGSEMRGASRAAPPAKDRGSLSLRGRSKRKRSRRVPPAGQTIEPLASGKRKVSICGSVYLYVRARGRQAAQVWLFHCPYPSASRAACEGDFITVKFCLAMTFS